MLDLTTWHVALNPEDEIVDDDFSVDDELAKIDAEAAAAGGDGTLPPDDDFEDL